MLFFLGRPGGVVHPFPPKLSGAYCLEFIFNAPFPSSNTNPAVIMNININAIINPYTSLL